MPDEAMDLCELLDQEDVWVDQYGIEHLIASMDPRYCASVVRYLARGAEGIAGVYARYLLSVPMPSVGTVAFDDVTASIDSELVALAGNPVSWLAETPLFVALAERAALDERQSMAGETTITVVGNLTADPELRFTPSGAAVANFTVASTPRSFDRASGEWKDGEALFLRCNIWRQAAENVAESLTRGMRVVVSGSLRQRSFDTREGEKRTVMELEVDEIGPSLRYATAKVNKVSRGSGNGGYGSSGSSGPNDDPWGSPAPSAGGGKFSDEPPF